MAINIVKGNIGNALTSTAANHVVAVSQDIYDESVNKYQSDINRNLENKIEEEKAAIIETNRIADGAVTNEKLSTDIQLLISNLSKTATFAGIATPTTNPGTPDGPVFYIANGKGTYTNFGGIDVIEDEVIILYYDKEWHKEATGIASQEKLIELNEKVNSLALGKFYGYFPNSSSLPVDITISGYAYVGLDSPYKIWNFNGESWSDSGVSIDMNDADEEDITRSADGKLKFKDRVYGDGMGYVILRKNKTFAEQVTKENTIYEIRYDFNLNNQNITIPEKCVLDFKGGSLSNGSIKYNNTIICGIVSIKCEQIGKFYTTENGNLRISMSYFGFENNKDCSSLVPNFVNTLKLYDNIQVDVDVINCYLGIVDLTGVWNVEFKANMSGYGRTDKTYTPNIIIDRIFTSLSYSVSFNGINIKGNISETAIDLIGNTRMFFVEKCSVFNANIGISVGTVIPATDNANVVIRDCILQNNNYGIVLNSGNGRVQCYSNFVVSNINNYVIRSGVNSLIGNTSDSTQTSFLGDILISGGGVSIFGHDSDVHKGYFINGTNADSMPLPISIINARHYDSNMKLEETPFSISLTGKFSVSIIGGYFFNELKFLLGSNFKVLVSNAHLLNGSINGDARIMTINNQDSLGDITNTTKRNKYSTFAFDNINGFLGELSKGDSFSFLNKIQNGLQLLNNIYLDESGNRHKLVEGFAASIFSFQNIFEIFKYSDREELLFRFGEYGTPYIMFKERRLFFGNHTTIAYAEQDDVCIDSITGEIVLYIYNGNEWISQHKKEIGTNRPTNPYPGFSFFETNLNKPIWWTGTKWVDATGADI